MSLQQQSLSLGTLARRCIASNLPVDNSVSKIKCGMPVPEHAKIARIRTSDLK